MILWSRPGLRYELGVIEPAFDLVCFSGVSGLRPALTADTDRNTAMTIMKTVARTIVIPPDGWGTL